MLAEASPCFLPRAHLRGPRPHTRPSRDLYPCRYYFSRLRPAPDPEERAFPLRLSSSSDARERHVLLDLARVVVAKSNIDTGINPWTVACAAVGPEGGPAGGNMGWPLRALTRLAVATGLATASAIPF